MSDRTSAPMALMGDRLPALAPLPTMSAVRNIGMPARCASPIASGASSATVAIDPGPLVLIVKASRKSSSGSRAVCPRSRRTPA